MPKNVNRYSRQSPADRHLRASDQDRDAVGEILRSQHTAGRLDTDEFADRYSRCLEARTYAELDELLADLPVDPDPVFAGWVPGADGSARRAAGPNWARRRLWRFPVPAWVALLAVVAIFGAHQALWLILPLTLLLVLRPLVWRARWCGPGAFATQGPCGRWSGHTGYPGPGTTV